MSGVAFSRHPPPKWDAACLRAGALFHTRGWQSLLERSFGCRSQYAWSEAIQTGAALTQFRAGPFRLGYLGFPVGGVIGPGSIDSASLSSWLHQVGPERPTCIRLAVSAFAKQIDLPLDYESNPETAIRNLREWDLSQVSENRRRGVKKAKRLGLSIAAPTDEDCGKSLFRIYRETVRSHGGALRYNEAYFSALIDLASQQSKLRVLVAQHEEDIAGFIVAGIHGNTTYYLHGGTDANYRKHCPSDLLMSEVILHAQQTGSDCFNFMSSPGNQPSLVAYKEKWGGETRQHRTYTLPTRPSYRLFRFAERIYHWIR